MSFMSREEFKQLANADLGRLYNYLTKRFEIQIDYLQGLEVRRKTWGNYDL